MMLLVATLAVGTSSSPKQATAQDESSAAGVDHAEADADCEGRTPTLVGTDGPDRLTGTDGPDVIFGLGGDDVIRGLAGDDLICAGPGDDRVFGGSGDDTIGGHDGDDTLFGGPDRDTLIGHGGDDKLFGHADDDILFGGPGDDRAAGGSGHDILDGGDGRDRLLGDDGPDIIDGGPSHDYLNGGQGWDELTGGTGNDYLDGGAGTMDSLIGGDGKDTIRDRFGGASVVDAGNGDDDIRITFTTSMLTSSIHAGNGNDVVEVIDDVTVPGPELVDVRVDGGLGNADEVRIPVQGRALDIRLANFELGDLTTTPPTDVSRCGGNVTLMLDTSFSVPKYLGGEHLKRAATGFLGALDGTPTRISVMGFDAVSYQIYPNLNGARGTYFAADDDDDTVDEIAEAIFNIQQLPNRDVAGQPADFYIGVSGTGIGPELDTRIGWTQPRLAEGATTPTISGGTNWEDAVLAPFYVAGGASRPAANIPRKVIWITDGEPNAVFGPQAAPVDLAVDAAASAVARVRSDFPDSSIVGVLVGPGSELEDNLRSVVGSANYISSSFDDLQEVLEALVVSDCGGVVTVRKSVDDGSAPTGVWTYTTPDGVATLDTSDRLSVPISFSFSPGQVSKNVTIVEAGPNGSTLENVECSARGNPVPVTLDKPNQSVTLTVIANKAISCTFVSTPGE